MSGTYSGAQGTSSPRHLVLKNSPEITLVNGRHVFRSPFLSVSASRRGGLYFHVRCVCTRSSRQRDNVGFSVQSAPGAHVNNAGPSRNSTELYTRDSAQPGSFGPGHDPTRPILSDIWATLEF